MSATPDERSSMLRESVVADASVADLLTAAGQLLQVAFDRVGTGFSGSSVDELLGDVVLAQRVQNSAWAVQTHRIAQGAAVERREDLNPVQGALPRVVSRTVRHEPGSFVDEWFPLEVATRLGWSDRQAGNRISDAVTTLSQCPRLLDRVGAGGLDPFKAVCVADVTTGAPDHVTEAVEERVLAGDPEAMTAAKLRAKARRLRVRLDPVGADQAARAKRRCAVGVWVGEHHEPGLSQLTAVLPTLDAAKLMAAIDQLARDLHDITTTDKTLPECRVDALTDLMLNGVGVDTQLTFLIPVTAPEPAQAGLPAPEDLAAVDDWDAAAVDDGEQATAVDWSDWDEEFEADPFGEEDFQRQEALVELVAREEGMTPINSRDLMDEELRALFDEELAELNAQVAAAAAERARTNARDANARDNAAGSDPPGCGHDPDTDTNADAGPDDNAACGDNLTCGHALTCHPTSTVTIGSTGTAGSLGIGDVLLPKVGIIPAQVVIEMTQLVGVKLSRALTDAATGTVVETADRSYRPGARLARFVQTRDQHCRFPGCTRPAKLSDIDHVIRYPDGDTTAGNLQCLCRHHHRAKHEAGWTVTMTPTGVCTWTSPSGHTYTTHPGD